jgi:photosystem II stability/assembly factor-like uncharacterized protein
MANDREPSDSIGNGEGEGAEPDELEVFDRRAEWFRTFHGDRLGFIPDRGRAQALAQASRLGRARLRELDPGGEAPKEGFEFISVTGVEVEIHRQENPRPHSSFGFASHALQVRSRDDLAGATLKITFDERLLEGVEPSTVRVFRFDDASREWLLVPRSGASPDGSYAWAQLRQPGLYVAVGLPRDPWLVRTVATIDTYMPWLRAQADREGVPPLLERICQLILCGSSFEEARGDPGRANDLDLPGFGDGLESGDICERCLGLDLALGGLPEIQILRDPQILLDIPRIWPWPWPWPWWRWCPTWMSCGPINFSGRIKSLAIHPTDGNTIYAGGADGGVWKTITGGASWYSTMDLELSMAIGAIGISASNPNVVYAATGENVPGWGPSYPGVGVYKTTDAGGDWDLMAPISSDRCSRVLVHPSDPNTVYVAGDGGLHKSVDGGGSWTNIRTDFHSDALMDPLAPNTLYAAVWGSGVYKSIDAGVTWTLLSNGIPTGSAADWIKLAMGLNGTDGTAFLVAKMGTGSGSMYKSSDAGANWTAISGSQEPAPYNTWTNMVAVDPNNQNVIFAGGIGVERSADGGATFAGIGGTHSDHHQLVFSPTDSNICYMATDGGVFTSTDNGVTFTYGSQGLVSTQLYSIGVAQTWPFLLGGATQDQGIIETNGPSAWSDTGAGNEGGFFIVDPNNSSNVYATPWSANLIRSTTGGTPGSWASILTGLPAGMGVGHLAVKPGDSNSLLCVGSNQAFRSTDQGNNWTSVLTVAASPTRVTYSPSTPVICFAATADGRVYKSTGSGAAGTWAEPYAAADRPPIGLIGAIAVGWNDPNLIYIAYGGWPAQVYRSTDGGAHWANASGQLPTDALPNAPISDLVIDQYNAEVLYVATDIGVFRSREAGDSWERFEDGMPRIVTSGLALRRASNTLYASTMGRGAYSRWL